MNRLKPSSAFGLLALAIGLILIGVIVAKALRAADRPGTYEHGYRVDKDPIAWRFPMLGEFEKCYWQADIIGDPRVPGPNGYWIKGFVVLDSAGSKRLKALYTWSPVNNGWNPSLDTAILNAPSFNWTHSNEFERYVNSLHEYGGSFYLDMENGIMFLDVDCC